MVIGATWGVADDTQAEERHLLQITGLCDGSTLHVAGKAVREVALNFILTFSVGDKLVAGADETGYQTLSGSAWHGEGVVEES